MSLVLRGWMAQGLWQCFAWSQEENYGSQVSVTMLWYEIWGPRSSLGSAADYDPENDVTLNRWDLNFLEIMEKKISKESMRNLWFNKMLFPTQQLKTLVPLRDCCGMYVCLEFKYSTKTTQLKPNRGTTQTPLNWWHLVSDTRTVRERKAWWEDGGDPNRDFKMNSLLLESLSFGNIWWSWKVMTYGWQKRRYFLVKQL